MKDFKETMDNLSAHDGAPQAAVGDFYSDPFLVQRLRLNGLFGEEYVTANPILIAAAVIEDELKAARLEMTQLQIAIDNIQSKPTI